MKTLIISAFAVAMLSGGVALSSAPADAAVVVGIGLGVHHRAPPRRRRHQVCVIRHHHRVCHWAY